MNNLFSQPKIIYKLFFILKYQYLSKIETLFTAENILGLAASEQEAKNIEFAADDIWQLEIYLASQSEANDWLAELKKYLIQEQLEIISEPKIELIKNRDWVTEYQKQLKPIEIGNFFITSSLRAEICPGGKIPIYIEASRAFGTGEHATTSLCVEMLQSIKEETMNNIIDVGTGSGILAFVANKLWPKANNFACDLDQIAVEIAQFNQKANQGDSQAENSIIFYQNSDQHLLKEGAPPQFDLIIANILLKPLIELRESFKAIAFPHTKLILSGFLENQLEELLAAYQEIGFILEKKLVKESWVSLLLKVNNI